MYRQVAPACFKASPGTLGNVTKVSERDVHPHHWPGVAVQSKRIMLAILLALTVVVRHCGWVGGDSRGGEQPDRCQRSERLPHLNRPVCCLQRCRSERPEPTRPTIRSPVAPCRGRSGCICSNSSLRATLCR